MKRKHMVEEDETLIIFEQCKIGRRYVAEGLFIGTDRSNDEILNELSDACVQVIRLKADIMALPVFPEDITEECARKYLYRMDAEEGVELDEVTIPAYVRNSRAWSLWKDDIEAQRPIGRDPDAAYDARRDMQVEAAE